LRRARILGRTPGRGALGPDALVPLLRAHAKPAKGPAEGHGIRPTLFSLRASKLTARVNVYGTFVLGKNIPLDKIKR
jgi:hypothetical protein